MNDSGQRGTHNQWTVWNVASLISVITTAVMVKVGDIFNGSGNYNGLYDYCWYGSMCEAYKEQNKTKPFAHLSTARQWFRTWKHCFLSTMYCIIMFVYLYHKKSVR